MSKTIKAALLAATLLLCLVLAACGSGAPEKKQAENAHQILNADGVLLLEDEAIDTGNADAQTKLETYLSTRAESLQKRFASEASQTEIYARGNTIVFETDLTAEVAADQIETLKRTMEEMTTTMDLKDGRAQTGVDSLTVLYALVNTDGTVEYSKLMK